MRRDRAMRKAGCLAALWVVTAFGLLGAGPPFGKKRDQPLKIEETVTDLATITTGHNNMRLEGVGLVVGLDKTGVEAPPSWYRERLVDEMRKAGVEHPEQLLTNPNLSIVIARLTIPTGTTKSDRLDVEIEVPAGCGTTSLAGGYLLQCRLKEVAIAGGTPKEGQELALAQGPVMIGTDSKPNDTKVGRVLGGAQVKKDSPFRLELKDNRKSFKSSKLIETVVNRRFHQTEGIKQNGMATAKTDAFLELRVPKVYQHNQFRYFRVIKLLPLVDNPQLQALRMAAWGEELLDPKTAGVAALRLEGMGVAALETLKKGLASPNGQVKFFAAEALAYLNDPAGVDILGEQANSNPEFRAFALTALAATDQSAARMKLVKLMDSPEIPVRYGAFNALRSSDETDPFLGRVRVIQDPPADPDEEESMSLAIANEAQNRQTRREDPFALYIVDTDGPPLVHLARTRRCEIVVFGHGQRLLTPIVLGTGAILLNAADGDESLQISKVATGQSTEPDAKVQASLELGDVIRQTAMLGAKYPDLVTILQAASRQKNLPGPLVVDALPGPTTEYDLAAFYGKDTTKKDDEVGKASAETSTRRFRLFGLFNRDSKKDKGKAAEKENPKDDAPAAEKAPNIATSTPAPKQDDSVTKSSLETTEKRSFFDRFRRR